MSDNAIATVADVGREQLQQLALSARGYADAGVADNTRRAYAGAWRGFSTWCAGVCLKPLPAEASTVALYLTSRAPVLSVSTLAVHLAAIAAAHKAGGFDPPAHPDLDAVWSGISRTHGRPPRKKRALITEDLRRVVNKLPPTLQGVRDRAILLIGFAGALRRSELAALEIGTKKALLRVEFVADGIEVQLDKAKGDQLGRGAVVAIPFGKRHCPVGALQAWLTAAGITAGPIFRAVDRHGRISAGAISDRAIADIVKAAAKRAGMDPAAFAGHSLRSGLITSAARAGAAPEVLMAHARHARFDTTMEYIQAGDRFRRNAAGKVGL